MKAIQTLLITGTDTGVGKTWISCLLLKLLHGHGLRVGAYKPVCSGAEPGADGRPFWNDVVQLQTVCEQLATAAPQLTGTDSPETAGTRRQITAQLICPQTFVAPLAPPVAARLEGRTVDEQLLRDGLFRWHGLADTVVVEGAGGLLSPLSEHDTTVNLARDLQCPLIIVAANRLGVVNHTLLTLQVARQHQLDVAAVILNDATPDLTEDISDHTGDSDHMRDISRRHNADTLQQFMEPLPLFHCGYRELQLQPLNSPARAYRWGQPAN